MSQNPNDPNNQKKSNPLKDATSHFIKKKGCRQVGKWQKWQEKQGGLAESAKLLKAGVVKIVGAIVGAVGLPVACIMALIITVCVILASFVPFTDDESKTEEQVKSI